MTILSFLNPSGGLEMAKAKKGKQSKGNKVVRPRTIGKGPVGKGTLIGVRVQPSLLARIDEWAERQDGELSRPDAMRRLIERGLSPGV